MFLVPAIAQNLESLKLDLVDWWDAQWNWCGEEYELQHWILTNNFFAERVLGLIPEKGAKVRFPSLKKLTLSSVHFYNWEDGIATTFNFSNLHSLKLRNCSHTGSLLRAVIESGKPVRLRELELVIPHEDVSSHRHEQYEQCVEPFLFSFQGLERLRLLVKNGRDVAASHRYWGSILHHKETLTELVYHERSYNYEWLDCGIPVAKPEVIKLFEELNLESLGMCIAPILSTVSLSFPLLRSKLTQLLAE